MKCLHFILHKKNKCPLVWILLCRVANVSLSCSLLTVHTFVRTMALMSRGGRNTLRIGDSSLIACFRPFWSRYVPSYAVTCKVFLMFFAKIKSKCKLSYCLQHCSGCCSVRSCLIVLNSLRFHLNCLQSFHSILLLCDQYFHYYIGFSMSLLQWKSCRSEYLILRIEFQAQAALEKLPVVAQFSVPQYTGRRGLGVVEVTSSL